LNLTEVLEISSSTDPGMVRSHNEDSVAADAANGLVVLADGMGGYNAGEVASGMATTVIITEISSRCSRSSRTRSIRSPASRSPRAWCAIR